MRSILQLFFILCISPVFAQDGKLLDETILVDGIEREYLVYVPKNYSAAAAKVPVVLAFHGGGGTAKNTVGQYSFGPVADKENFIVVYPNGIEKSWNDGRIAPKKPSDTDDVKFISMLIDKLVANYAVDSKRVFSTGLSNGAIFSIYLAYKLSDKILAIAPVCGSMPTDIEKDFALARPVSAVFINGTADKLVPYEGGPVLSKNAGRGDVIGVEKLQALWIGFNHCTGALKTMAIDDSHKFDGCKAEMKIITGCTTGTELVFIKIIGGGHTWPGGKQYLPKIVIGNVCRDFNAEEVIWQFFKRQ